MRNDQIAVRQARLIDNVAMKEILRDTFASTWRPYISPDSAQAYLATDRGAAYVDQYGRDFWVADLNGQVVGLVHWQGDFVRALHVWSSHFRRGIGRRLMDLAEKKILMAGFRQVRLETDMFNEGSRAFYVARGFSEAGRYPDEEWDSDLTTILLIKQLS